jgi:hypothetical protein
MRVAWVTLLLAASAAAGGDGGSNRGTSQKREMMGAWNGLKRALLSKRGDPETLAAARAEALPHAAGTPALAKLVRQADALLATLLPVRCSVWLGRER